MMKTLYNDALVVLLCFELIKNCTIMSIVNSKRPFSWMHEKTTSRRLVGEWITIDCTVNDINTLAELWDEDDSQNPLKIDNETIKMVEKNIFNVTKVTSSKIYICKAPNTNPKRYFVEVNTEVKSYLKPRIIKLPNKTSYNMNENLVLLCEFFDMQSNIYSNFKILKHYYFLFWEKDGRKIKRLETKQKLVLGPMTSEKEGIYKCVIQRKDIYSKSSPMIKIKLKELTKPTVKIENDAKEFSVYEGNPFSIIYHVTSNPASDIYWSHLSDDGQTFHLITRCLSSENHCQVHEGSEKITRKSFRVESAAFPENNLLYMLNASNIKGYETKKFSLQILVKPRTDIKNTQYTLHNDEVLIINCTLKPKFYPWHVNFTWYKCKFHNCENGRDSWAPVSYKYSLFINKEGMGKTKYRCTARNTAGKDTSPVINVDYKVDTLNGKHTPKTIMLFVIPTGVITVVILLITSYVLFKRKKLYGGFYLLSYPPMPDYIEKIDINRNMHEQMQKLPYIPEWEFPRERITFINELGSGEFGVVWLAEAIGISAFKPRCKLKEREHQRRFLFFNRMTKRNNYVYCKEVTKVAVKKVKDNGDRSKQTDLLSELKILIHVGENENIVNILGACTKGDALALWVIMEYCEHGNLREFLRNSRGRYKVDKKFLQADLRQSYGPKNLMELAYHISKGMAFLISRKIIHRDLAARNILLGAGYIAKVGDFGLARDVYKHQAYTKNTPGLVPLKWMAIESIKESLYTEKSDIWSFGIVLWELFTLGGTPYPGIPVSEVYKILLSGKRMEPPIHCPEEISYLMMKCWNENPELRPTFLEVKDRFDVLFSSNKKLNLDEKIYVNENINKNEKQ